MVVWNPAPQPSRFLKFPLVENFLYVLQGLCRGLTHGQKIGVTYFEPQFKTKDVSSVDKREANVASHKSPVVVISSDANPTYVENNNGSLEESSKTEMDNQSAEQ